MKELIVKLVYNYCKPYFQIVALQDTLDRVDADHYVSMKERHDILKKTR